MASRLSYVPASDSRRTCQPVRHGRTRSDVEACSLPVWQDHGAGQLLRNRLLAFAIMLRQSNDVRNRFAQRAGPLPTHGHDASNDGILVPRRQVRATDGYAGKEEAWVRTVRSEWYESVPCDRGRDPFRPDDGQESVCGGNVVWEVGRGRDDMGDSDQVHPAFIREGHMPAASALDQCSELGRLAAGAFRTGKAFTSWALSSGRFLCLMTLNATLSNRDSGFCAGCIEGSEIPRSILSNRIDA